jgi:hypothetical protein
LSGSREWRNRQTRTVQVRVPVRAWGFNSPLAHPRPGPDQHRSHRGLSVCPNRPHPFPRRATTAQRAAPLMSSDHRPADWLMDGMTCAYTLRVIVGSVWPSRSATSFAGARRRATCWHRCAADHAPDHREDVGARSSRACLTAFANRRENRSIRVNQASRSGRPQLRVESPLCSPRGVPTIDMRAIGSGPAMALPDRVDAVRQPRKRNAGRRSAHLGPWCHWVAVRR